MKGKPAFSPNPKFTALLDGYSGNAVNGVDERRPASPKDGLVGSRPRRGTVRRSAKVVLSARRAGRK